MQLSLFDWHCDTVCEMMAQGQQLERNTLAVSLEGAACFDSYVQVMAFFTRHDLDDEAGWERFLALRSHLLRDPAVTGGKARCATEYPAPGERGAVLLFGIEDARIFAGKPERVEEAYRLGVRILTPLWAGETCIGGSHDTAARLTDFGRQTIRSAVKLGMIPDISHASEQSAGEMFEIAAEQSRPVIASHSNAKAVCDVSRNLSDAQIRSILACGGIIGLNLYVRFLSSGRKSNIRAEALIPHIELFLEQGAEASLCLGGDWDGADLPTDLRRIGDLPALAELLLRRNYSEELIGNLFFGNADRFARKWLAKSKQANI